MGKKSLSKKPQQQPDPKQHLLLGIKRDELEIRKYEKLLKIRKRKNKCKISEIFMDLDPVSEDDGGADGEEANETDPDAMEDDEEDVEDINDGDDDDDEDDDDDMSEEEEEERRVADKKCVKRAATAEKAAAISGDEAKIKRNVLAHLNRLCESQMMKCLDGIEEIWNEYPRGDVRDIFIRESVGYMGLCGMELAALVASLHTRLAGSHTNLIAFYLERLLAQLPSASSTASWTNEATLRAATEGYKFVAYVTRLETIDTHLIVDLMLELGRDGDTPQLKLLAEISSIVGFLVRKHNSARCDELVAAFKARMASSTDGAGDISEIRSVWGAIVDKLTTAKAKNDVMYAQAQKYRKLMRVWCRKASSGEAVALRLVDLRGDNRARWWLVGSAVSNPQAVINRTAAAIESAAADSAEDGPVTEQDKQWTALALELGFATEGKQSLFRTLMRVQARAEQADGDDNDGIGELVERIAKLTHAGTAKRLLVPESEVVALVVRCLTLQRQFCQLYPNLLAALIETNRRFRQLIKCAIWDVIAQPKLVDSARINCGRCVGQLIAVAEFPVNCLRKYNFLDDSSGNVGFMTAVVSELVEESWDDIADLLQQMASSISTKFVGNLRLFLKKNFKGAANAEKWSKSVHLKVDKCVDYLQELRKNSD